MLYQNLPRILIFVLICFSLTAQAETTARYLEEAEKLIAITPSKALAIAREYLNARTLVTETKAQGPTTLGRDDSDKSIRTPESTIRALLIISRAQLALRDPYSALQSVEEAEKLASNTSTQSTLIEVEIFKIDLLWQVYESQERVQQLITTVEKKLSSIDNDPLHTVLEFELTLTKAKLASALNLVESSDKLFLLAEEQLEHIEDTQLTVEYALELGKHNLKFKRYNRSLYNLLGAYWQTVEEDSPLWLAKTNRLLAELYFQRGILDKSLDHLSQAADFYDNYGNSVVLSSVLNEMANIYYMQGRYNLALVHYFNVLDGETIQNNLENIIELRLNLAQTYLQLYNYPLTEQYIKRAESLLAFTSYDRLKALSLLIQSELNSHLAHEELGIKQATKALAISKEINSKQLQSESYLILSAIHEKNNNFEEAYSYLHQYNKLTKSKQNQWLEISEDDFTQQTQFIERSIHYKNQEAQIEESKKERARFQSATAVLFILSAILVLLFVRRGMTLREMNKQLAELYRDHYTHPRSGLRNLRLLNVKLPSSLEQSSANFEQWQTGDLIHEPLHDKLRFIMVDLPFLRTSYLRKGYKAGLELEEQFGEYIKTKIISPARLYHFSDAMFLYVAPNTNPSQTEEELFEQIKNWILEFEPNQNIERLIRAGIADYPFLPRAYTAINDKELLDILLMALGIARKLNLEHGGDQWVSLKAIENAPAASFANEDIRSACKQALTKGLIKMRSSHKFEDGIINFESID